MTAALVGLFLLGLLATGGVVYGAYRLFGPALKARLDKEVAKVSDKIVGE